MKRLVASVLACVFAVSMSVVSAFAVEPGNLNTEVASPEQIQPRLSTSVRLLLDNEGWYGLVTDNNLLKRTLTVTNVEAGTSSQNYSVKVKVVNSSGENIGTEQTIAEGSSKSWTIPANSGTYQVLGRTGYDDRFAMYTISFKDASA